jgi:hypothetical protein
MTDNNWWDEAPEYVKSKNYPIVYRVSEWSADDFGDLKYFKTEDSDWTHCMHFKPATEAEYNSHIDSLKSEKAVGGNMLFDPELKDQLEKHFNLLGFRVTKDDGRYGAAECARTNGMTMIEWNREGRHCTYFGEELPRNFSCTISKDGGTRTAFNGYVFDLSQLDMVVRLTM